MGDATDTYVFALRPSPDDHALALPAARRRWRISQELSAVQFFSRLGYAHRR
jgi:hypothetical protein